MRIYLIILSISLLVFAGCTQAANNGQNNVNPIKIINVGKGPDAMFLTPNEKYFYVANVEDTFISVIDIEKDEVVKEIEVVDFPWGFVQLGDTSKVALSGYGGGIDIVDFSTNEIVKSIELESPNGGITASSDGKIIYVISINDKKVLKINAETYEVDGTYDTGNGPDGIGISKDNKKLYVTNTEDGTISVIDVETKQTKLLETGGKPELVHSNKDNSKLYISNFLLNKIHIIDTSTNEIVKEIENINGPEEAVLSPDERNLFVVSYNDNKVSVFNADSYVEELLKISTGVNPIGIIITSGNKVYVTNYKDNTVGVYDLNEVKK